MVNTLQLKAAIVASGKTRDEVAAHLGISSYSLSKKLHNITEFKASEISSLAEYLNAQSRLSEIFFAHDVENNSTISERRDA